MLTLTHILNGPKIGLPDDEEGTFWLDTDDDGEE